MKFAQFSTKNTEVNEYYCFVWTIRLKVVPGAVPDFTDALHSHLHVHQYVVPALKTFIGASTLHTNDTTTATALDMYIFFLNGEKKNIDSRTANSKGWNLM
jgi:hypothetical protein